MEYQLYITDNCVGCDRVVEELRNMQFECEVVNVSSRDDCPVMIFPALKEGDKLLAYGDDIVEVLKAKRA